MNNEHSLMMQRAKSTLSDKWLTAAVGTLIYIVIMSAAGSIAIGDYIIGGPMSLGYILFLMCLIQTGRDNYDLLFVGFRNFAQTLVAGCLSLLAISIGTALLIVPGIIAALGFSMTFFIMADDTNITGMDALQKSWNMMNGHKADLFCLWLRFIGWILLALLTCGIGFLWVQPYMTAATYNYYRRLRYGSF